MEIIKKPKGSVLVKDVPAGKTFRNDNHYYLKLAQHGVIQNILCGVEISKGQTRQFIKDDTCQIIESRIEVID